MGGANRGRVTVSIGCGWRLYTNTVPAGSNVLGVVSRDGYDSGALIITPAGVYAQLNAGAIRALDQRKVMAAIEAAR